MKSIIIIPSRMDSSRFPGKPLAKIDGIPMIQRVWQQAISSNIGMVYVACAEKEIYELIIGIGGKAILTDPNLPSGTDRIHAAFQLVDDSSEIEYIINLQGDMPLINSNDIKKVIEPLQHKYSIGTLVTNLKSKEYENSNVTKVKVDWKNNNHGKAIEFFRFKNNIKRETYHHVGIYSYTKKSLLEFIKLPISKNEKSLNLEQYRAMDAGMSIGVSFVSDIAPSVDTKDDLITVESIIRANNEKN